MENINVQAAHAAPSFDTRPIWRTFWILLGITLVELTLATIHLKFHQPPRLLLNGIYLLLTLAKAFYIIAEFMHLGHELKTLIMSLVFPAMLFIWFLIAFLWDGDSFRNMRNEYDPYHVERSHTPVQQPHEGHEAPANKPGSPE